jgi:hypothetical protein
MQTRSPHSTGLSLNTIPLQKLSVRLACVPSRRIWQFSPCLLLNRSWGWLLLNKKKLIKTILRDPVYNGPDPDPTRN